MKILAVCYMGMNRSQYLASYLKDCGFDADCGGILLEETKNPLTQEKIDESDILIFVLPRIREKFLAQFQIGTQELITLDVEDRLEIIAPEVQATTHHQKLEIYEKLVYPKLIEQVTPYIKRWL